MCLQKYWLHIFHQKVAIEKSLLCEENCLQTLSTLIVPWMFRFEIARSSYKLIIWTQFNFQNRFFSTNAAWVLFSRFRSLVFYLCCTILLKNVIFYPSSGFLVDQIWQKVLLVLTCLDNQFHVSSALPSSFLLHRVNRQHLLKAASSFIKNMQLFLHRTSSPGWPNAAKVLLVPNYLDIPTGPSRKQHFGIHLSKRELTVTSFWMFPRWNKFWLCLQIGMLISWTCKNVQVLHLMFLVFQTSNWIFSKAVDLNSFDKISIEMFVANFSLCVKISCCLSVPFFIRHNEGKYSSSTSLLVCHGCWPRGLKGFRDDLSSFFYLYTKAINYHFSNWERARLSFYHSQRML